ncbi:hypothetical protein KM043_012022 [Ampulex compressa]|nr:hypothetical protein KM043_012022 [Ampulex compressa]
MLALLLRKVSSTANPRLRRFKGTKLPSDNKKDVKHVASSKTALYAAPLLVAEIAMSNKSSRIRQLIESGRQIEKFRLNARNTNNENYARTICSREKNQEPRFSFLQSNNRISQPPGSSAYHKCLKQVSKQRNHLYHRSNRDIEYYRSIESASPIYLEKPNAYQESASTLSKGTSSRGSKIEHEGFEGRERCENSRHRENLEYQRHESYREPLKSASMQILPKQEVHPSMLKNKTLHLSQGRKNNLPTNKFSLIQKDPCLRWIRNQLDKMKESSRNLQRDLNSRDQWITSRFSRSKEVPRNPQGGCPPKSPWSNDLEQQFQPDPPPPKVHHWTDQPDGPCEAFIRKSSRPAPMIFIPVRGRVKPKPFDTISNSSPPSLDARPSVDKALDKISNSSPSSLGARPSVDKALDKISNSSSLDARPSVDKKVLGYSNEALRGARKVVGVCAPKNSSSRTNRAIVFEEEGLDPTRLPGSIASTTSWEKSKGRFTMADVGERRPNMASLKYRLTKCPSIQIVDDWYHLEHRSVAKRSTEPHVEVHQRLLKDSRVRRAEQQRAKSRSKRDMIIKRGPSNTQIILNDERWPQMWYLNRGKGLDMNVQAAWAEGITGSGVVVTILDDGLEKDHPDLFKNYDPQASYDVNNNDEDPMPRYDLLDSNRHGTRCAGEVAATANNSICAVGVAFGAGVGGVRMLDGDVTDAVEARSLSLNPQHIDIYSASWGPDDDGKTVDGPGELATRAFIEGITKGRNGKGSIFVWASGNGGRDHDNCNCDGYTNSIWTLSISSATENGYVPWYSEACSSTLATTYSSGSTAEKQVVTTDLHHHCTSSHTGTSASAPLAAGICALALEANRDLTWRDMQHIVVRTARPANLRATDWVTNGVGRNVSHSFGYGLMDAAAMVRLARRWRTVPEQHKCEVSAPHMERSIPAKSQLVLDLYVKECSGVNFLEHVQAKVSLVASRRGDLQIQLTSPQGTMSTLLAKRPHDVSKAGFNQWPFMSVHTWGERPHGKWQLLIHNEGRYQGRATLHEWALIFYGTATLPDRTEYALYNPAGMSIPRRPFVKPRETAYSKGPGAKGKQAQHKSDKSGSLNPPYVVNAQMQSQRKGKARGQHKNGKSANRAGPRPTAQTLRGLTAIRGPSPGGEARLATSRPRGRSTPSPVNGTTTRGGTSSTTSKPRPTTLRSTTSTSTTTTTTTTVKSTTAKQRLLATASSLQRGLILLEPPQKAVMNNVPAIFQQYSKILYPLYPVYAGARGVGQHATRAKGLDLLQDEQFDPNGFQLDKGISTARRDSMRECPRCRPAPEAG